MTINIDYYVRDSLLHIDMFDDSIIYQREWSKEILGIRETITLSHITTDNILKIKKDIQAQYEEKVKEYYLEKTKKHLSSLENKEQIDKFFNNLIGVKK